MQVKLNRGRSSIASMLVLSAMFASTAFAADPFVGTWKLNLEKSHYKQGLPPQSQIVTIKEVGSDLSVRVDAVTANGSKTVVYYSVPIEGGQGKMFESAPAYDGISGKHIGPGVREIIRWKDGKEVFNAHAKTGTDGKTLTAVTTGVSPLGKPVDAYIYYDRVN
jgi:hypothetical protein